MPLMHSESIKDVKLFKDKLSVIIEESRSSHPEVSNIFKSYIQFADDHIEILMSFGRYPHRNELLGRLTTVEEYDYLHDE